MILNILNMGKNVKKLIYIVIVLVILFILSGNQGPIISSFSHSDSRTSLHSISYQTMSVSKMYQNMNIKLTSSLKPINGYSYGNFDVLTTFYASVFNGTGTYTYQWFVNSTLVRTAITSSNTSSLIWNFTNKSKFGGGIFDYVNVTVTDSSNQSSFASYYGSFWYEPEIFLSVSGNDAAVTPGTMNITVSDWLDVSPLNFTVFVNGKPVYNTLTAGWGAGFPMSIKYNFTKTGIYNITAVAYDDSGQRIVAYLNITIMSQISYSLNIFYNDLKSDFSPSTLLFSGVLILLLADITVEIRGKWKKRVKNVFICYLNNQLGNETNH